MKRIFGKSFLYAVDCYEKWHNQKCECSMDINGQILGIIYDKTLYICTIDLESLGLPRAFSFQINSPSSQMLEPDKNSLINEPRIQYFNEGSVGTDIPYICHLFCKYGRINYVRFAKSTHDSSPIVPTADTIHEFYGDMITLGGLDEEGKNKARFVCDIMLSSCISNPYKIQGGKSHNEGLLWNDMSQVFAQELDSLSKRTYGSQQSWEYYVALYAERIIKDYYDTTGQVPKAIVDHICEDVFTAAHSLTLPYFVDTVEQLKVKVFFDLTQTHN